MERQSSNYYSANIFDEQWKIPIRYEELKKIGRGGFGVVCSARDTTLNKKIAIKRVTKAFDEETSDQDIKKKLLKLTYREIKLLKHVNHVNVIKIIDIFTKSENAQNLNEICFVFKLAKCDLHSMISNTEKFPEISQDQIIWYCYQIIKGVKYLHSCNIIHRDLKPNNILIFKDDNLKIIDFGLARKHSDIMSPYLTTIWYSAPELMINEGNFDKAVDVWSIGCILAEMYLRSPLISGSNYILQLVDTFKLVGVPSENHYNRIKNRLDPSLARLIGQMMQNNELQNRIGDHLRNKNMENQLAIDLIEKMLQMNPSKRITCNDALKHSYINKWYDPEEDDTDGNNEPSNLNDLNDRTVNEWKELIFDEIRSFIPNHDDLSDSNEDNDGSYNSDGSQAVSLVPKSSESIKIVKKFPKLNYSLKRLNNRSCKNLKNKSKLLQFVNLKRYGK